MWIRIWPVYWMSWTSSCPLLASSEPCSALNFVLVLIQDAQDLKILPGDNLVLTGIFFVWWILRSWLRDAPIWKGVWMNVGWCFILCLCVCVVWHNIELIWYFMIYCGNRDLCNTYKVEIDRTTATFCFPRRTYEIVRFIVSFPHGIASLSQTVDGVLWASDVHWQFHQVFQDWIKEIFEVLTKVQLQCLETDFLVSLCLEVLVSLNISASAIWVGNNENHGERCYLQLESTKQQRRCSLQWHLGCFAKSEYHAIRSILWQFDQKQGEKSDFFEWIRLFAFTPLEDR